MTYDVLWGSLFTVELLLRAIFMHKALRGERLAISVDVRDDQGGMTEGLSARLAGTLHKNLASNLFAVAKIVPQDVLLTNLSEKS